MAKGLIGLIIFGVFLAFIVLVVILLSMWTDRSLEFWFAYFNHQVDIPLWMSAIVTIVTNGLSVVFNILTEIFRLVL